MGRDEFESWMAFYRLEPFDDMHRIHRPAALVARSMSGGDIAELLAWLRPEPQTGYSDADATTLKALGITPPTR